MRHFLRLCAGLTFLTGCPEYTFPADAPKVWGEPNPPPAEATVRVDRVLQVVEPVVDVLWVIDNSRSMVDDQEALASNFPRFIEPFADSGVDYHVGVVSTDMNNGNHMGKLQERFATRWVSPTTADMEDVFTEMATQMSTNQLGIEKGRAATHAALGTQADDFNKGFLRPEGWLHITVVTDEDDDTLRTEIGKDEFVSFVNTLKPSSRVTFNSVVALVDTVTEERGQKYMDLTDRIGGSVQDLNGGDWDRMLEELGGLQAPEPMDEFFLSAVPVLDTLEVHVIQSGLTWVYVRGVDYVYNQQRNSIQLEGEPPLGAEIQIVYTVASSVVD